jgi:predicted dehydrogenase
LEFAAEFLFVKTRRIASLLVLMCLSQAGAAETRIGLIGLDTSHVTAFTRLLNDPTHKDHVPGGRVTVAFRAGSPDVEASRTRIDKFTSELTETYGVRLVDSIEELCRNVDAVMLESVDGRPHLAQAIPVILAKKPLFIDKPMAGSLGDVLAIFRLAEEHDVPVFSASSLRYGRSTQAVRAGAVGRVVRAETFSPCSLEPHHPDLFWYGIHGVEALFTVMGRGCESVRRIDTPNNTVEVEGHWSGGRVGHYQEGEGYGGKAEGEKGSQAVGGYDGYRPLLLEVIKFFETSLPPVDPEETIELFAFMEAADESRRRDGELVTLSEVLAPHGYVLPPRARLIDVRKIWDASAHNAFTDLIRYDEQWFCVFREGQGHVSSDGAIQVIRAGDAMEWQSVARLNSLKADLRDPKLSHTPDGRLMLVAAGALHQPAEMRHQTYAWFSSDGKDWGEPVLIGEPDIWLWRATWCQDQAFGVGYHTGEGRFVRLYRSSDGKTFETLISRFFDQGFPNEATLAFAPDDTAVCLLRRDGPSSSAQLGWSSPPYAEWAWKDLGVRVGGPNLVTLPNGEFVAGVRLYEGSARTALGWLDSRWGRFRELLSLPSGGDTSYPGLVWWDGQLWVSYYSSHEGKTSIYLARVEFTL